jgi:tetratricopeptide (TPR) repeat protein
LVDQGQAEDGIAYLLRGLTELRSAGAVLGISNLHTPLARAYAMLGRSEEKRNCLVEAARLIETTDERFLEAEILHRVPGDLLAASGDRLGAEQHYRQAIAISQRQNAKLLQLRAAGSLARLWHDQGKRAEAREVLAPIYAWFTEGFDAPVLKEAKALLDELI